MRLRSDASIAAISAALGTLTDDLSGLGIRTHRCRYRPLSDRFEFEIRSFYGDASTVYLRRRLNDLFGPAVYIAECVPTFPKDTEERGARATFVVHDIPQAPPAPGRCVADGGALVGGRQ